MRVAKILRKLVRGCRPSHRTRAQCVFDVVDALVRCKRLTITSLGRAIQSRVSAKHNIKRVDRLVGNGRLTREKTAWYAAIANRLVGDVRRPLVLIDWTGTAGFYTISASVPAWGRSIPVYSETHPRSRHNNRQVNESFLRSLKDVLPSRCTPIVVADAGFHSPFWDAVHALHWGFVIRVRNPNRIIRGTRYPQLLEKAAREPTDLGTWSPEQSKNLNTWRLVLGPVPVRKRTGNRRSRNVAAYRRGAKEAWLLVTNERAATADHVVSAYAKRMQIEEAFRDIKSHRFGWSFSEVRSGDSNRIDALLLLAALATFVVAAAGMVAETRGLARRFQANTVARRRVLSIVTLGRLVLTGGADFRFRLADFVRPFRETLRASFCQKPNREFIDYNLCRF